MLGVRVRRPFTGVANIEELIVGLSRQLAVWCNPRADWQSMDKDGI